MSNCLATYMSIVGLVCGNQILIFERGGSQRVGKIELLVVWRYQAQRNAPQGEINGGI